MKKISKSFVAIIALCFTGLSMASAKEKTWTNFLGFGITAPSHGDMDIKAKEGDDFKLSNMMVSQDITFYDQVGVSVDYMGIHKCGFAVKSAIGFGYSNFNNTMKQHKWVQSSFMDVIIGAGFAPIRSENFTLAAFGTFGITRCTFDTGWYDGTAIYETTTYYVTRDDKVVYTAPSLGLNVTGAYTFTKHFSVYGSLNAAYVFKGDIELSREFKKDITDEKQTREIDGTYRIIPTVGICWKF